MKHRHLRLDLKNRVGLSWHGLNTPANLENISIGGALLRADLPVKVGESLAICLEDKSWPNSLEMSGEVIRLGHMRRGMPSFALQFRTIPETLKMFLRHVLATRTEITG